MEKGTPQYFSISDVEFRISAALFDIKYPKFDIGGLLSILAIFCLKLLKNHVLGAFFDNI